MNVTFVTGNKNKAKALEAWLGHPIAIKKLDLDEIQSVDVKVVSEHKARQAYEQLHTPVLVEDVGLAFSALNGLPGALIKWFITTAGLAATANIIKNFNDTSATAICIWTYFDGKNIRVVEGYQAGTIAPEPRGDGGYGWDAIFIPEGSDITRSEMTAEEYERSYTASKNFTAIRDLLLSL